MADPSDSRPPVSARDSLTPERIARLRELHEAATPGPWQRAEEFNGSEESWDVNAEGGALEVAFCPEGLDPVDRARTATDAELIAEARNALPELLDAVERLRAAGGGLITAVFYDRDQQSDESAERLRWCLAAMAAELPNPDGAPGTPSDAEAPSPQPSGADALRYIRDHYQVPARPGRRVVVDGNPGIIVGGRDAYLLVRFAEGDRQPCHPTWRVEYVQEAGQ